MGLWDVITRFVIPPILGGVGAVVTPWFAWDIEKRRDRTKARRELIATWRKELLGADVEHASIYGNSCLAFMSTEAYVSLRPHLSEKALQFLEPKKGGIRIVVDSGLSHSRKLLADEIAAIEKGWKLL